MDILGQIGPATCLPFRGDRTPLPAVRYAVPFDLDAPGRYVFFSELWGDDHEPPPAAHFDTDSRLWIRTQIVPAGAPLPARDDPGAATAHDLPALAGGRWWLIVELYRASDPTPHGAIWGDLAGAWTVAHVSRSETGDPCGPRVPWRWVRRPGQALLERSPYDYPARYSAAAGRGA